MIQQIKSESDKPVLLIDAGGLLFEQPVIPGPLLAARKIQATGIIRGMRKMNYSAVGIAAQDLALGLNFLEQQYDEFRLPWISANLKPAGTAKGHFQPYIIKQVADISIAIIGVTGEQTNSAALASERDYQILSWQNALPDTLDQVREKADMIILLSSYPELINRKIAERFNEINLIIQSGTSTANKIPQLFGNTIITQISSRGKYIGRMDIDWEPSHRWRQDASLQLKQARDRLDRVIWRLGRVEKQFSQAGINDNQAYQQLLQEKKDISRVIIRLEQLSQEQQDQLSSFTSNFIGLKIALPEDPEVRKIVLQTKLEVNNTNKKMFEKIQQAGNAESISQVATMTGWRSCQSCHGKQTRFWQQTKHARAWQTLEKVNQQFNQDCIRCHVTLRTYDMETVLKGNLLVTLPPDFRGVSCEACHGPGKNHAEQPEKFKPARPDQTTCLQCHTPDHDNNFIFAQKVRLIRCPASDH